MFKSSKAWFAGNVPETAIDLWKNEEGMVVSDTSEADFLFSADIVEVETQRLLTENPECFVFYHVWIQECVKEKKRLLNRLGEYILVRKSLPATVSDSRDNPPVQLTLKNEQSRKLDNTTNDIKSSIVMRPDISAGTSTIPLAVEDDACLKKNLPIDSGFHVLSVPLTDSADILYENVRHVRDQNRTDMFTVRRFLPNEMGYKVIAKS